MLLPIDFAFTQNNLQDFIDCPRRFQLKYVQHITWPAPISEPVEEQNRLIQLGSQFHRMVQQYYLGIPENKISRRIEDADLQSWWDAFLSQPPSNLPVNRKPEIYLSMPFEGYRLAAKIDLLAVEKNTRAVIVDWKTSHKPPRMANFLKRIQSLVYPYLVINAGNALNEFKLFKPAQVSMIYWFPAFPEKSIPLTFDQTWLEATHNQLTRLVSEIKQMNLEIYPLTSNPEKCRFCRYRSLCERGISAGNLDDEEDDIEQSETALDINFEEIQGIAF
ncbi:MAG: PD-(D/E)XK nuclease family protein [Leptolinea sp.]